MRTLKRNQVPFWYANPVSQKAVLDEYGNETSDIEITYSLPVEVNANISPARGTADLDMFGINESYTKTIVSENKELPINKATILWIDSEPDVNGEAGNVKHDYVVVAVAKSLNSVTIAIKGVDVS